MRFELIAKTMQGLEEVLAKEIINLGGDQVQIGRRMVSFTGDQALLYKANLHLRTAVRILKPILSFNAKDSDEVYEQIRKIEWENYLQPHQTFAIDTVVYSEFFRHSKFLSYRVKDGVADYFNEKFGKRPSVRLTNPDIYIHVHVSHNLCTVSLDSSGESLHKRGYRVDQTEAPLNEVLAAGMLLLAGWDGQCNFIDPMCGSGTLLIEAALIALRIPPGIYRKFFAFEKWKDFDAELFEN
ncbi:MAG: class I SAM-dependent RNA methyltransferase, partial [Bacteroidales bacterium]|nr:class I SAM-dependent RNA methyltransferase [Bacteroidales bacterium]